MAVPRLAPASLVRPTAPASLAVLEHPGSHRHHLGADHIPPSLLKPTLLLPLILLLTLGLLTTFVTAWALAAFLPHDNLRRRQNVVSQPGPASTRGRPVPLYITIHQFSRPGMIRLAWKPGALTRTQLHHDLAPRSTIALKVPTVVQDRSWGHLPRILDADFASASAGGQDARGWPCLALWCRIDEAAPSGHSVRGGIALSSPSLSVGAARALPYLPIWRGVLVNSLIFAIAWGAIAQAFKHARSAHRRRRGRCPHCAYVISDESHRCCPECGKQLSKRRSPQRSAHAQT